MFERGSVQISKMELDSPEHRHMELSELSDYPPRIHLDLSAPMDGVSAPAELRVQGVKGECSFLLANECELYCAATDSADSFPLAGLPLVSTEDFMVQSIS